MTDTTLAPGVKCFIRVFLKTVDIYLSRRKD